MKGDINEVILVGGQTRMPAVSLAVERAVSKKTAQTDQSILMRL